jgi:hypothetical protein
MRWFLLLPMLLISCSKNEVPALAAALATQDPAKIQAAVEKAKRAMGSDAGEPEVPDEFRAIPKSAELLSLQEAQRSAAAFLKEVPKVIWWSVGQSPQEMKAPLREVASAMTGTARDSEEMMGRLRYALPALDSLLHRLPSR